MGQIDWEQRHYEMIKDFTAAFASNRSSRNIISDGEMEDDIHNAVLYANEIEKRFKDKIL